MGQSMVFPKWPTQNWKFSGDSAIYFPVVMAQEANPWVCDLGLALFAQRRSHSKGRPPVYDSNVGLRRCKRGILPLDEPGSTHLLRYRPIQGTFLDGPFRGSSVLISHFCDISVNRILMFTSQI